MGEFFIQGNTTILAIFCQKFYDSVNFLEHTKTNKFKKNKCDAQTHTEGGLNMNISH